MSKEFVFEEVPKFSPRIGDHVLHGSNNSIIILGRDRAKSGPATVDDGLGSINSDGKGKKTGVIHLISGLSDKDGNPDVKNDLSFAYIAMKSDVDKNTDLKLKGKSADSASPAILLKSDLIRVLSRKNMIISMDDSKSYILLEKDRALISINDGSSIIETTKDKTTIKLEGNSYITIEKGKIVVDGDKITLGKNAVEKVIKGDSFKNYFLSHTHPTGVGPSGPVIEPWIDETNFSKKSVVE